ncbi:Stp1/IreP family PP2C-type Ser/Thr phosphatase [Desulfospira joergensenii]|uniref:Stp1/IreP family PP2C-type Ser/Thr phosphatase n=1 Tax=Desulfospira joergensenii TaxID=53329 RepID=UPI0003B57AD8|nr:Stp1/IreP family PP2C-type Ser/Thr phosphatase [Desulfospira joergensenii]
MKNFLLSGRTDLGQRRKRNEDTIFMDPDRGFCLVADGIGGTAAGHIASQLFADSARNLFSAMPETEDEKYERVQKIFLNANDAILDYAGTHAGCEGMGCTAELLVLAGKRFILGHIGDSRTYRFRSKELKQLTKDHSLVQEQLDQGLITPEEAAHHSFKNVILRAVGIKKNPALDVLRGNLFSGDIFLLCSDGLTDMVSDDAIKTLLGSKADLEEKVNRLVQEANANGGKDNISVVLAQIL